MHIYALYNHGKFDYIWLWQILWTCIYILKMSKGQLKVKFRVVLKIAYISLTVQDRAISSKFFPPRVFQQGTLSNFQEFFVF